MAAVGLIYHVFCGFLLLNLIALSLQKDPKLEISIGDDHDADKELTRQKNADGSTIVRYIESAKPYYNIGYLGRGYNEVYGNILETDEGGDKGVRLPVFQMEYSSQRTSDWRFLLPKHVDVQSQVFCDSKISTEEVSKPPDFKKKIEESSETCLEDEEIVSGKSSSASEMIDTLETGDKKIVITSASCSLYRARINPLAPPNFHPSFKDAIDSLPKEYNAEGKRKYAEFINIYGTAVVSEVLMGARYGKEYVFDTTNNGQAEDEKVFSIGAEYNEDAHAWAAEAEKDPIPIKIKLLPLSMFVSKYVDDTKGGNLAIALSEYRPKGVRRTRKEFGQCYQSKDSHLVYRSYIKRTSLIARCEPGDQVLGGTFRHLWNSEGDVHVDSVQSSAEQIMKDLQEYHHLRAKMSEAKYILNHGSKKLKEFTDNKAIQNIGKLFGKRVNPDMYDKFLEGKLTDLGLKKEEVIRNLHNAMKIFGKTALANGTKIAENGNPYLKSIAEVSKGVADEIEEEDRKEEEQKEKEKLEKQESISLSTNLDIPTYDTGSLSLNSEGENTHAIDSLIQLINGIDEKHNYPLHFTENTKPLFIDTIREAAGKVVDHVKDYVEKNDSLKNLVTSAMKVWSKFSGDMDNVWMNYQNKIKEESSTIKSSPLYQHVMESIRDGPSFHATTLLANRNSLNWMFPRQGNSWVCGSGNRGTEPSDDGRSSMGVCKAFCCKGVSDWTLKDVMNRDKITSMEKRTSEIVAPCPPGEVVVSGGILITDYQDGRFVQVTASRPEKEGWKCAVKWTTESGFEPYVPRFRCYARCAKAPLGGVNCDTKSTELVNGHGTARCPVHQMAVSGGWDVSSPGITYFKKTQFDNVHPKEGPRGYRCEMGSSHDPVNGKCFVRCCDVFSMASVRAVSSQQSAPPEPYWKRKGYSDIGSYIEFDQALKGRRIVVSENGKYHMKYDPKLGRLEVFEEMGALRRPHRIGLHQFNVHRCRHQFHVFGRTIFHNVPTYLTVSTNGMEIRKLSDNSPCASWTLWKNTVKRLQLDDSGGVTFYDDDGEAVHSIDFSKCRLLYKRRNLHKRELKNGEMMFLGDGLLSHNRQYMAIFAKTGILSVVHQAHSNYCHQPKVLWRSDGKKDQALQALTTSDDELEGWIIRLTESNNLEIRDDYSKVVWESGTKGEGVGRANLIISNEGELQLQDAMGKLLWDNIGGTEASCTTLREKLKIRSHRAGTHAVLKPGVGGLVSKNEEFILYIRKENGERNLELWRNSGPEDCKPVRICVLKENVSEARFTRDGIKDGDHLLFEFPYEHKMNEVELTDSGKLIAYGGHSHRREFDANIVMDCPGLGGMSHDSVPCNSRTSFFGVLDGKPSTQAQWNTCPKNTFLRGWMNGKAWPKALVHIKSGECCKATEPVECEDVDWVNGEEVRCPPGSVLNGFLSDGSNIGKIQKARCCRAKGKNTKENGRCVVEGKWNSLDSKSKSICEREGFYLAGFKTSPCTHVYCIEKFICCEL